MNFTNFRICLSLALVLCAMPFVSCQKDGVTTSYSGSGNLVGEVISKGVCVAFDGTSETAQMCYVADEDVYYIDYFYKGDGSFGFKWDKETNKISIIYCDTCLLNGFYPIDFLDQKVYESEMGDEALPSYYNPVTGIFTFNVLYQTAVEGDQIVRGTGTITYSPKAAEQQ